MPTALIDTCPLCGLRFSNMPLLELHIREDHRRADSPEGQPGSKDDGGWPEVQPAPLHSAE